MHLSDTAMPLGSAAGTTLQDLRRRAGALVLRRSGSLWLGPVATLAGSVAILALSRLSDQPWASLALGLTGGVLLTAALLQVGGIAFQGERRRCIRRIAAAAAEDDPAPAFLADSSGRVLSRNRAARQDDSQSTDIAGALGSGIADPRALVEHLRSEALRLGHASAQALSRRHPWTISARHLDADTVLWRLESGQGTGARTEPLPRLTLDAEGRLVATNPALRALIGSDPTDLAAVVQNLPLVSGRVHRIACGSGPEDRLVVAVAGQDGQRDLYLLPPTSAPSMPHPDWTALEALPVPLLRLSPTGLVLAANRHARALLPVPDGESRLSDLLEGLGRPVGEWVADVAAGRAPATPQFLRGTGEHQDVFLRVAPHPAGPPEDPHLLAVLDDVTELKSLEAQFVQSQKMQALGQLAGGVAHDFNNVLTAISGHSDLLLLRHDAADPDYGDLMQIRQNVNRAAGLVGQLLAFSRKQSMLPETLDLRVVLSDLTHLLNRLVGERVRLTLDHEPTLRWVRADKRQLEQVIMNLVVNARDAMPDGGQIRIETANHRLDAPMTRDRATVPAGDYVLVRVTDEGTGIPPERLQKIFEPFYTTKKLGEGTGLGLSTVYGIVKQSGAYVFVESELGQGSAFTLWFPAHDRPASVPKAAAPEREPIRPVRGSVLLVEDEAAVRSFAARALRLRGHTVHEADSGETALAQLSDPALRIDLILTDVILPDADGPTWVREALADRPDARVIFMSGYAEDAFAEQKALVEGSVFLPKPFSLTDLTALVERQMAPAPTTT